MSPIVIGPIIWGSAKIEARVTQAFVEVPVTVPTPGVARVTRIFVEVPVTA